MNNLWPTLADSELSQFRRALKSSGIQKLATSPFPYVLSLSHRQRIIDACEAMYGILEKVGAQLFSGNFDSDLHPLSPEVLKLLEYEERLGGHLQGITRFDIAYEPATGAFKFLECNTGDPSGAGLADTLLKASLELPTLANFIRGKDSVCDFIVEAHADYLRTRYSTFRPDSSLEDASIAFLGTDDSTVFEDHQAWVSRLCDSGIATSRIDPRRFTQGGAGVHHEGKDYDLLIRDTIDDFVVGENWSQTRAIRESLRANQVCLANPISAVFGDFKSIFAQLCSGQFDKLLSAQEKAVLDEYLPSTFWPEAGPDLSHCIAHKNDYVLKPNLGYGGYGVVLGAFCSKAQWRDQLERAAKSSSKFVMQAYIPLHRMDFQHALAAAKPASRWITLSSWVMDGRYAGTFARYSANPVVNVHQSGGLVPCIFN